MHGSGLVRVSMDSFYLNNILSSLSLSHRTDGQASIALQQLFRDRRPLPIIFFNRTVFGWEGGGGEEGVQRIVLKF